MKIDKTKEPKDYIILALDVDSMDEAKKIVRDLKDKVFMFKVGLPLYTSVGPDAIKMINDEGAKVFFDGKFHDIPNTVAKAGVNLVKQGVSGFTVHIKGGSKIVVTQNGRTQIFSSSGEAAVYPTHQEIILELFKGWA